MPNQITLLEQETSSIIGLAIDIHKTLGCGFLEIVYKDALEYELRKNNILYHREREYKVNYADIILPHRYFADFVVFDSVIVEIKAQVGIGEIDIAQTLNYLKCSKCRVGLILNHGTGTLGIKRVVL